MTPNNIWDLVWYKVQNRVAIYIYGSYGSHGENRISNQISTQVRAEISNQIGERRIHGQVWNQVQKDLK